MKQFSRPVSTTDSLKGLAILTVLINHYLNRYVVGNSTGFANAWITIFFFLSGYGIFYSLNRCQQLTSKDLLAFYGRRLARIFPLLWLAWLVEFIVSGGDLSPWILASFNTTDQYWFIPTILQCYLAAPLIYILLKRKNKIALTGFVLLIAIVNYIIAQFLAGTEAFEAVSTFFHFQWRECYFIYILVFGAGMLTPQIISKQRLFKKTWKTAYFFWAGVLFINIIMLALKQSGLTVLFQLLPLPLIAVFCYLCLRNSFEHYFLSYLGRLSYSIYLFHISYYIAIYSLGSFPKNSIYQLALSLAVFPAFLFICRYLENFGKFASKKLVLLM